MHPERHAAITAPVSNRTWEGRTILLATQQETGRIEVPLRQPTLIIGMRPVISQRAALTEIATPTLFVAGLDDIQVYIDISEKTRLTSRFDLTRIANTEGGMFVSLSNFIDSIGGARMMDLELTDSAPVIGMNFAWKRPIVPGAPWYSDVEVGLSILGCYPDEKF